MGLYIQNGYNQNLGFKADPQQVERAVKPAVSMAVSNSAPDSFISQAAMQAPFAAAFEGIPLLLFLNRNKKLNGAMNKSLEDLSKSTANAFKNIFNGEGKLTDRIVNYIKTANENRQAFLDVKGIAKAKVKEGALFAKSEKLTQKAAQRSGIFKWFTNWRAKRAASKVNDLSAAASKTVTASAGSGGIKGLIKSSSRGAGFMLAFSGIIEGLSEIYPAFRDLGFIKGMKQLAKSAVKVCADTAGYIAGEAIGTSIGAAIGTAVCPVIGTAAGAAIGAAAGMIFGGIGSHYAGKAAKAVTGKSENEIAQERLLLERQKNFFMSG